MERDREIIETVNRMIEIHRQLRDSILKQRDRLGNDRFEESGPAGHERIRLEQELARLNAEMVRWCRIRTLNGMGNKQIADPVFPLMNGLRSQVEQTIALIGNTIAQFDIEKRKTAAELQKLRTNTHAIHSYVRSCGS